MISRIRISDCLSCIGESEEGQRAALRECILRELHREILRLEKLHGSVKGRIVVRLRPRRFQLYGALRMFSASDEGKYRLDLPVESWAVSDRNLSSNEFSVIIE